MKNSRYLRENFLIKTKEYFWLGIVIMFLGVGGVMLPFLYDGGHPDEVLAMSFDTHTAYIDERNGADFVDSLVWVDGVYYSIYPAQNSYDVVTSTDGITWGASSTVATVGSISGGRTSDFAYNENGNYFGFAYEVYGDEDATLYNAYTTSSDGITWSATSSINAYNTEGGYPTLAYADSIDWIYFRVLWQ